MLARSLLSPFDSLDTKLPFAMENSKHTDMSWQENVPCSLQGLDIFMLFGGYVQCNGL